MIAAEPGTLILRAGTQDGECYDHVFVDNEYRLPRRFAASDVILDVGANVGTFAAACLVRGAGRVVSLEPEPRNFSLLRRNVAQWGRRAECRNVAVWRSDDEGTIYLADHGDEMGATHAIAPGGTVPVQGVGLDTLLKELGSVRLVKLDCEGSEYPALFTAKELRRAEEIVGEYHALLERERPWDCTSRGLKKCLEDAGFEVELVPAKTTKLDYGLFFARRK